MAEFLFIYCLFPDKEKAIEVGKKLLEERLVACINVLPGVESFYWWEGKIDSAAETVLIAKTRAALFNEAKTAIERLHPYRCPCIISLPVEAANLPYLDWITQETKTP